MKTIIEYVESFARDYPIIIYVSGVIILFVLLFLAIIYLMGGEPDERERGPESERVY